MKFKQVNRQQLLNLEKIISVELIGYQEDLTSPAAYFILRFNSVSGDRYETNRLKTKESAMDVLYSMFGTETTLDAQTELSIPDFD